MKKYLIITLLAIMTASCGGDAVRIESLLFNADLTNAYYDGEKYTGKAWSPEGKFICLTCEEGKIVNVEVFHSNGKIALRSERLTDAGESYDDAGNVITMEEFVERYPRIVKRVEAMVENMYYSEELE